MAFCAIDDQTDINNYLYDEIGNLIYDKSEGLQIQWNLQNKLAVTKKNGRRTQYEYDALGNRVAQRVAYSSGNGAEEDATYYVRDAQGNTLSTYTEHTFTASGNTNGLQQESVTLYGAARLGEYRPNERDPKTDGGDPAPPDGNPQEEIPIEMKGAAASTGVTAFLPSNGGVGGGYFRLRGHTHYEYTNHLGNVLATTSDRKLSIQSGSISYTADVLTLTDYYAFGQAIAARGYAGSGYAYSINGQLRDTEIDPNGNHTTALYWEYDSRIGRRWNIDPVVNPSVSGYATFDNCPIAMSDVDGDVAGEGGNVAGEGGGGDEPKFKEEVLNEVVVSAKRIEKTSTSPNNQVFAGNRPNIAIGGDKFEQQQVRNDAAKGYLDLKLYSESMNRFTTPVFDFILMGAAGEVVAAKLVVPVFSKVFGQVMKNTAVKAAVESVAEGGSIANTSTKLLCTARDNLLSAVQNSKLRNIVNDLYRPGAKIGSGSSMDAFRLEQLTGGTVGGKTHAIKLLNYRTALQRVWGNRANLSASDRQITKQLLEDIQDALSGHSR